MSAFPLGWQCCTASGTRGLCRAPSDVTAVLGRRGSKRDPRILVWESPGGDCQKYQLPGRSPEALSQVLGDSGFLFGLFFPVLTRAAVAEPQALCRDGLLPALPIPSKMRTLGVRRRRRGSVNVEPLRDRRPACVELGSMVGVTSFPRNCLVPLTLPSVADSSPFNSLLSALILHWGKECV